MLELLKEFLNDYGRPGLWLALVAGGIIAVVSSRVIDVNPQRLDAIGYAGLGILLVTLIGLPIFLELRARAREAGLKAKESELAERENRLDANYRYIEKWKWILQRLDRDISIKGIRWEITRGVPPFAIGFHWKLNGPLCPKCSKKMIFPDQREYHGAYVCLRCSMKNGKHSICNYNEANDSLATAKIDVENEVTKLERQFQEEVIEKEEGTSH